MYDILKKKISKPEHNISGVGIAKNHPDDPIKLKK